MPLTAEQIRKNREARLAAGGPGMTAGKGTPVKEVPLTAEQQANEIANRNAANRTVTPPKVYDDQTAQGVQNTQNVLRQNAPIRTSGNVPVDSSLAGTTEQQTSTLARPYRGVESVAGNTATGIDGSTLLPNIQNRGVILTDQANQAKVGAYRNILPGQGNHLNEVGQSVNPNPYNTQDNMQNQAQVRGSIRDGLVETPPQFEMPGGIAFQQRQEQIKNMSPELARYVLNKKTGNPSVYDKNHPMYDNPLNNAVQTVIGEDGMLDGMGGRVINAVTNPVDTVLSGLDISTNYLEGKGRETQNANVAPIFRATGRAVADASGAVNRGVEVAQRTADDVGDYATQVLTNYANGEPINTPMNARGVSIDPTAPQVYRRDKETGAVEQQLPDGSWVASDALEKTGVDKPDSGFTPPKIDPPVIPKPEEEKRFPGSGTSEDPYVLTADDKMGSSNGTGVVQNQAKNSIDILRDQGLRQLKARDTALGRQQLGIPTASNYQGGLRRMGGGTATGGRMAQVLADNRVKYADRHARQQQRQLQRALSKTGGGAPGIANRQALQADIANQRTNQTALAGQQNDLLRTQMNNQSRERGQDLSYDASLRSTEATQQYRDQLIKQGYSEMAADQMTAQYEKLDEAFETNLKDMALSFTQGMDEEDAEGYAAQVRASGRRNRQPGATTPREIAQEAQRATAEGVFLTDLSKIAGFNFRSMEDLQGGKANDLAFEATDDGGKTYHRIQLNDYRFWAGAFREGPADSFSRWWNNDTEFRIPGTGGKVVGSAELKRSLRGMDRDMLERTFARPKNKGR